MRLDLSGVSLFVHTPTYNGWVSTGYAFGLIDTAAALRVPLVCSSEMGPLLARNRDELTMQFGQSDATHMLCIDADVWFEPDDVARLLAADRSIVAGCYPRKNALRDVPASPLDDPASSELIRCDFVPAGFMLVRRDAIEAMAAQLESQAYGHNGMATLPFWQPPSGSACGEDVAFCRRAREAGHDVWLHQGVRLGHYGMHRFEIDDGPLRFIGSAAP